MTYIHIPNNIANPPPGQKTKAATDNTGIIVIINVHLCTCSRDDHSEDRPNRGAKKTTARATHHVFQYGNSFIAVEDQTRISAVIQ